MTTPLRPLPEADTTEVDRFATGVTVAIAFSALLLWFLPDLREWVLERLSPRPSPPEIARRICAPAISPEQLHIVVVERDGMFAFECMYIGSRGTYSRQAR